MTRKFICVQGSPEIPKGAIAHYVETQNKYFVWQHEPLFIGNTPVGSVPVEYSASFLPWQIEGNSCWEEVKEEPAGKWVPEYAEKYYFVTDWNIVDSTIWAACDYEKARLQAGNVFRTEQEAQEEVKRRESIAKAWWPEGQCKGREPIWWWSWEYGKAMEGHMYNDFLPDVYIGSVHKTKEACEEWGKTYGHLFDKRPKHGEQ